MVPPGSFCLLVCSFTVHCDLLQGILFVCCKQCLLYVANRVFCMLQTVSSVCCKQLLLYVANSVFCMLQTVSSVCCKQCLLYVANSVFCMLQTVSSVCCKQCLLYVANSVFCIPVLCPKQRLYLVILQSLCLCCNLSKFIPMFV